MHFLSSVGQTCLVSTIFIEQDEKGGGYRLTCKNLF